MAESPGAPLNHEAIPSEQPLAASPGPDLGQRSRARGGGWLSIALALVVAAICLALLAQR